MFLSAFLVLAGYMCTAWGFSKILFAKYDFNVWNFYGQLTLTRPYQNQLVNKSYFYYY